MVLTPIVKHKSSLPNSFYGISLCLPPARRLEIDVASLARYKGFLQVYQVPNNRHNYRPNRPETERCPQRRLPFMFLTTHSFSVPVSLARSPYS